jgi:hypothetical protein
MTDTTPTHSHLRSDFWKFCVFALLVACGGGSQRRSGLPMNGVRLASMRSGVTTHAEVVEALDPVGNQRRYPESQNRLV